MLWWLVVAVLLAPVACTNGTQPETTTAIDIIGTGLVIDRLRNEILRRMRNQRAAKSWSNGGLKRWQPPPKPQPAKKQKAAANVTAQAGAPAKSDSCVASGPQRVLLSPPPRDSSIRHPVYAWDDSWLSEAEFKHDIFTQDGYVYCRACIEKKKNTNLAKGKPMSDSWQRCQLVQHRNGDKHKDATKEAIEDRKAAEALRNSRLSMLSKLQTSLAVIIRFVYWLCIESIAMIKLSSLYDMVQSLSIASEMFKDMPKNYVNHARCREFVMALSAALKGRIWQDILNSPYVSILIDESTDISTSENLIIYFIYEKNGRAQASYVALLHAPHRCLSQLLISH